MERASAREASWALCLRTQKVRVECLAKYIKQTEEAYAYVTSGWGGLPLVWAHDFTLFVGRNVRDAYKKSKAKLFELLDGPCT
ncbi:hypothetical protein PsorP6_013603 [Peronosclerospora sorghi]|uniref:Uncharacterized protein n=1 Tax=Peronosclerospora sorghi TaxID=230839 RepID=A0ACC0VHI5_9STRA|nr:hypothetical protein PsorP6_013603 [Peronosclerospora sorghi]